MQHPQQQLELDGRREAVEAEADVVDDRGREQRGDAGRRPQLVRGAQLVVQPQAGVALPHRRHLGSGPKKEGVLHGHFMKTPQRRQEGAEGARTRAFRHPKWRRPSADGREGCGRGWGLSVI